MHPSNVNFIECFLFTYNLATKSIQNIAEDLLALVQTQVKQIQSTLSSAQAVEVNIICYSAGAVLARLLQLSLSPNENFKINRVIMISPLILGCSIASIENRRLLNSKVFDMFDTSEAIVARLKPTSAFLHKLATDDIFVSDEEQKYKPDKTMLFVIQGTLQFDLSHVKQVKGSVTRGSDGIVPYSASCTFFPNFSKLFSHFLTDFKIDSHEHYQMALRFG